jgi:hypothetical protein
MDPSLRVLLILVVSFAIGFLVAARVERRPPWRFK